MRKCRLIARLDVKGANLIKGIHLEGLRVIGSPNEYAFRYYEQGIDELLYMDCVASLYGRNNLFDVVRKAADSVFVPMTVGGGIRSLSDVRALLSSGADKVAVNTAAVQNPSIISEIAGKYGSQCTVLSVEAKRVGPRQWEAYTCNGRERSGLNVLDWVHRGVELGAGEVLITSVDREGTRRGLDIDLISAITARVSVPVIASGGLGTSQHLIDAVKLAKADAVAVADILHYNRATVGQLRADAREAGIELRQLELMA